MNMYPVDSFDLRYKSVTFTIVFIIPQISIIITCGIQPSNDITMVMKMLHNSCNM